MRGVGGVERVLALLADRFGGTEVHRRGGVQADPGMTMLVVVVGVERLAVLAGVLDRPEPVGKRRVVLQRLETGLDERVVVGLTG